jgi:predicted DNA-binding ribbon-helix-helix protein
MHRTQIYLEKTQWKTLQSIAQKKQRSTSEIIRGMIEFGLQYGKSKAAQPKKLDLLGMAKRVNSVKGLKAPADLASRVDHYLYGKDE